MAQRNPIKNLKKRRRREAIENELKIVNFPGQSLAKNELWKSVMISNIESLKRKGIQRLRWVFNLMLDSLWSVAHAHLQVSWLVERWRHTENPPRSRNLSTHQFILPPIETLRAWHPQGGAALRTLANKIYIYNKKLNND